MIPTRALLAQKVPQNKKIWYTKPETYPLVAILAFATGWLVYSGVNHLKHPEVHFRPERRSAPVWDPRKFSDEEVEQWNARLKEKHESSDVIPPALRQQPGVELDRKKLAERSMQ